MEQSVESVFSERIGSGCCVCREKKPAAMLYMRSVDRSRRLLMMAMWPACTARWDSRRECLTSVWVMTVHVVPTLASRTTYTRVQQTSMRQRKDLVASRKRCHFVLLFTAAEVCGVDGALLAAASISRLGTTGATPRAWTGAVLLI
ncbi:hypothetical protein NESM_000907600 [Novymonas esmeraldas]|uniref:Uncharacterized protein n=1 Tax=Novymonas esmeraldas TaxID=1808958 RepID=A0AAW0F297_9TRYP